MPNLLFKLASRSRQAKLIATIENILSLATTDDFLILVSMDIDDSSCTTPEFKQKISSYEKVKPVWGISEGKVSAINRDIWIVPEWNVLVNISDDIVFTSKGFDQIILDDFKEQFPDGCGLLHYPDGFVGERQVTMSIMDKAYYDLTGYIYNPEYISLFCDTEAMQVAKELGKHRYVDKNIFRHNHPAWGAAQMDEQYRHTESFYNTDRDTYFRRMKINFGL